MLDRAKRVADEMFTRLESGIEPKSLEGLIGATVKVWKFLDELHEKILGDLPDSRPPDIGFGNRLKSG
jgi:hypothetical protein